MEIRGNSPDVGTLSMDREQAVSWLLETEFVEVYAEVSPDGRRFLMIREETAVEESDGPDIIVVQNWTEELRRLVPDP